MIVEYMQFEKMLKDFSIMIPKSSCKKTSINFFDIAGFPDRENVWSNIIAFFLNDSAEHGFGNLWAKSLLECAGEIDASTVEELDVTREYPTENRGRIDMLLNNSEYTIGIENKVHSGIYNDLDSYKVTINTYSNSCKAKCILLTLYDESVFAQKKGWINITYEQLLNQIDKNIWGYLSEFNTEWFIFMKHFISNVKRKYMRIKEENEVSEKFLRFFDENQKIVDDFINELYNVKLYLKRKAEYIIQKIKEDQSIKGMLKLKENKIWNYNPNLDILSAAVIKFPLDGKELKIQIDYSNIIEISIFYSNGDTDTLENEFSKLGEKYDSIKNHRLLLRKFSIDTSDDEVLDEVRRAVEIVAKII